MVSFKGVNFGKREVGLSGENIEKHEAVDGIRTCRVLIHSDRHLTPERFDAEAYILPRHVDATFAGSTTIDHVVTSRKSNLRWGAEDRRQSR